MKLRIGNACWHAFHVQHAALALEAGFFAQEGIDAEIVHAKINPKAISSSRPGGERYDDKTGKRRHGIHQAYAASESVKKAFRV